MVEVIFPLPILEGVVVYCRIDNGKEKPET